MDQTGIQSGSAMPKASETGVQTGPPPIGTNGTITAAKEPGAKPVKQPKHPAYQVLEWLADLRITVTLFALALVLVFWGTLAQVDNGVWTVVKQYFRSAIVLVPLKVVLFNGVKNSDIVIPFPGGWLIGGVMLVNLLAAHAIRFKLAWNRSGILLIHAGIIVMMFGELITGLYAIEGQMVIQIGESGNTVIDARNSELAIIHNTLREPKKDDVVMVPGRFLKTGASLDDDRVPFKMEVIQFMVNSKLVDVAKNPNMHNPADKGFAKSHIAVEQPEVSGVDPNARFDQPSAYIKLFTRDGKEMGTWLFTSLIEHPQWIAVAGKKYQVVLRFKQTTRDFKIHLTDFQHQVFPGTNTPKDFHSFVEIVDKDQGRPVEIYMNHPLYYRGETFYQSSWTTDPRTGVANGTILSVVRNPGWLMPYFSCAIVGVGLLIHFGLTLYRFVDRRIVR
jgi:hypothetical protein